MSAGAESARLDHEVTPTRFPHRGHAQDIMAAQEMAGGIVFGSYTFLIMQVLVALCLCQIALLFTIAAICYRAVATSALYMRSLVNKSSNLSAQRTI